MPTEELCVPSYFTTTSYDPKAYTTGTTTAAPSSSVTITADWSYKPILELNYADAIGINRPRIDPKDCMISDKFDDLFVCPCFGCCACSNVTDSVCEGLRNAYKRGLKEGEI